MGMSFIEHCNTRRVEMATLALSATDLNTTEVTFGCGISKISHFYRQLKANYGLTPGEFRCEMDKEDGH